MKYLRTVYSTRSAIKERNSHSYLSKACNRAKKAKKRIGETFSLPRSCQTDGRCFLPVTRPFEFPTISLLFLSFAFSRFCPAFVGCNGKEQMRGKRVHSRALINFSPWFFKTCVSLLSMETSDLERGYLRV